MNTGSIGMVELFDCSASQEKALNVVAELDAARIIAEEAEDYEHCAELRDMLKMLSDYVLGYVDKAAITLIVYWAVRMYGELQAIDEVPDLPGTYECSHVLGGHLYVFYVDFNDYLAEVLKG